MQKNKDQQNTKLHFSWDGRKIDLELRRFIEKCPKKIKVIDIGCGTGTDTIELSKRCYSAIGLNKSKEQIKMVEQRSEQNKSKSRFIHCNAERMPFMNNSFDIAIDNYGAF